MKAFLLLLICILPLSFIQATHTAQASTTEAEGTACMGDNRSKKQTEQAALMDAKRRAIEFVSTHVKSETEVKDLQLEMDLIDSFANAEVKVIQELEKKWYKDVSSGDCYLVKIKAEVIPDSTVEAKISSSPSKNPDSDRNRQSKPSESTPWLPAAEFKYEFDRQFNLRRYPPNIEGRNNNGSSEFRAKFVPFPQGAFYFWSHHSMDKSFYDRKYSELYRQGFTLKSLQTFIDRTGIKRYQATWVKDH